MSSLDLWRPVYVAAVCEMDNSCLMVRILEARAAIEQRLLRPLKPGSTEELALRQPQVVLAALKRHSESKQPSEAASATEG